MTDSIPDDIKSRAAQAYQEGLRSEYGDSLATGEPSAVVATIARAIMAETRLPQPHVAVTERECLGILNPDGGIWTTKTFDSENAAMNHLRNFWKSTPDADLSGYRVVRAMAKVTYIGEIDRAALAKMEDKP